MRLLLITVIIATTLLGFLSEQRSNFAHGLSVQHGSLSPPAPSTDPCDSAPCGNGAECKSLGTIAICVCPNSNDKGDPFVACMQEVSNRDNHASASSDQNSLLTPTIKSVGSPTSSSESLESRSVHQAGMVPVAVSAAASTTPTPSTTSTTPKGNPTHPKTSGTTTTTTPRPTTRNPFVHVFDTTTSRPPPLHGETQGHHNDRNQPESHRIPIIDHNRFPQHSYPPRPIGGVNGGGSTSSSGYLYPGSTSSTSSSSYDIFNDKTVAPSISSFEISSGALYRGGGSSGIRAPPSHLSGSHNAYEYDSRPGDRFGHHDYHPTSSGFPGPITESSSSRYSSSGTTYDIYNYNQVRNDLKPTGGYYNHHNRGGDSNGFTRIPDPLGKYENCRMVNGIVVCADNRDRHQQHYIPSLDRGDVNPTTNYGFHLNRDRDEYSTYYPSRYPSTSSVRPVADYNFSNRQGYPDHGPRYPIELDSPSTSYYPYAAKEQQVSSQSVLSISSTSSSSSSSTGNENSNSLCKTMCGINSVCRLVLSRPVCGCSEGTTGDPSVRCSPIFGIDRNEESGRTQCERHVDCRESEICAKKKCIDPCKEEEGMSSASVAFSGTYVSPNSGSGRGGETTYNGPICGSNAECLVVGHTPVCKCSTNYFGNPYVACTP